jgi:hypothetical protein
MTYFAGVTTAPNTSSTASGSLVPSLVGSLLLVCCLDAAQAGTTDPASPEQTVPQPGEAAGSTDAADEQCSVGDLADPAWVDRMRLRLSRAACASSAWFDGFFGTERRYEDYRATYGSVSLGTLWDERDGFDPRLRFRIRMQLPQADARLNAFIGRVNREEFVTGREEQFDALPSRFGQEDDDELLLGLGWSSPARRGSWFDTDVGVKIALPLDPYVRGSWKLVHEFSNSTLLRVRESAFWRNTEGFGVTSRADVDYVFNPGWLMRWSGVGTLSEQSQGVDWYTTVTLFQSVDEIRALAYQASYSGETDREVPIKDWGLQVIYRQRISREWLFVELRSSVTWPKDEPQESREPNWGVGIAVEMLFGDRLRARQLERLQEIEETR